MAITEKSIKLLWANAAGRCSFTDCPERLTVEQAGHLAPHTLGEMAHIKGKKKGSSRYDPSQTTEQRDCYENLILLCPNHHNLIDKRENEHVYTVDIVTSMKLEHESNIRRCLDSIMITNTDQLRTQIAIRLAENRQAWFQYGPSSENAILAPNDSMLHSIWLSERLSTIVPNNRIISGLLETYRSYFDISDQDAISAFLSHAKSYEKWVRSEIPYPAVTRFPISFELLIMGDRHAI